MEGRGLKTENGPKKELKGLQLQVDLDKIQEQQQILSVVRSLTLDLEDRGLDPVHMTAVASELMWVK